MYFLSDFCRICLKNDSPLEDVMGKSEEAFVKLEKLRFCVPEVSWTEQEDLPLCETCIQDLNIAYNFKKQCGQSINAYTNYLKSLQEIHELPVKKARIDITLPKDSIHDKHWQDLHEYEKSKQPLFQTKCLKINTPEAINKNFLNSNILDIEDKELNQSDQNLPFNTTGSTSQNLKILNQNTRVGNILPAENSSLTNALPEEKVIPTPMPIPLPSPSGKGSQNVFLNLIPVNVSNSPNLPFTVNNGKKTFYMLLPNSQNVPQVPGNTSTVKTVQMGEDIKINQSTIPQNIVGITKHSQITKLKDSVNLPLLQPIVTKLQSSPQVTSQPSPQILPLPSQILQVNPQTIQINTQKLQKAQTLQIKPQVMQVSSKTNLQTLQICTQNLNPQLLQTNTSQTLNSSNGNINKNTSEMVSFQSIKQAKRVFPEFSKTPRILMIPSKMKGRDTQEKLMLPQISSIYSGEMSEPIIRNVEQKLVKPPEPDNSLKEILKGSQSEELSIEIDPLDLNFLEEDPYENNIHKDVSQNLFVSSSSGQNSPNSDQNTTDPGQNASGIAQIPTCFVQKPSGFRQNLETYTLPGRPGFIFKTIKPDGTVADLPNTSSKSSTDFLEKGHFLFPDSRSSSFECDACNKQCGSLQKLELHVLKKHGNKMPFKCEQCGSEFLLRKYYEAHMKTHPDNGDNITLESFNFLETQQLSVQDDLKKTDPNQCNICHLKLHSKLMLRRHMARHRGSSKPNKYFVKGMKNAFCKICNRKFSTMSYLNIHMEKHRSRGECTSADEDQYKIKRRAIPHFLPQEFQKSKELTSEQNNQTDSANNAVNPKTSNKTTLPKFTTNIVIMQSNNNTFGSDISGGNTSTNYISSTAVEGISPAVEGGSTAVEESSPAVEGSSPAVEGSSPAVEGSSPAIEESSPALEESSPALEESSPAVEESNQILIKTIKKEDAGNTNQTDNNIERNSMQVLPQIQDLTQISDIPNTNPSEPDNSSLEILMTEKFIPEENVTPESSLIEAPVRKLRERKKKGSMRKLISKSKRRAENERKLKQRIKLANKSKTNQQKGRIKKGNRSNNKMNTKMNRKQSKSVKPWPKSSRDTRSVTRAREYEQMLEQSDDEVSNQSDDEVSNQSDDEDYIPLFNTSLSILRKNAFDPNSVETSNPNNNETSNQIDNLINNDPDDSLNLRNRRVSTRFNIPIDLLRADMKKLLEKAQLKRKRGRPSKKEALESGSGNKTNDDLTKEDASTNLNHSNDESAKNNESGNNDESVNPSLKIRINLKHLNSKRKLLMPNNKQASQNLKLRKKHKKLKMSKKKRVKETEALGEEVRKIKRISLNLGPNIGDNTEEEHFLDIEVFNGKPKCSFCKQLFSRMCDLKRHIYSVHLKFIVYSCQVCNQKFCEDILLTRHLKLHFSFVMCKACSKPFPDIVEMEHHMLTEHKLVCSSKCGICDFECVDIGEMKCHSEKHEERIIYQCHLCNESFKECYKLTGHLMEVFHKELYQCYHCFRSFHSDYQLYSHEKDNINCSVCGVEFLCRTLVASHELNVHGIKSAQSKAMNIALLEECIDSVIGRNKKKNRKKKKVKSNGLNQISDRLNETGDGLNSDGLKDGSDRLKDSTEGSNKGELLKGELHNTSDRFQNSGDGLPMTSGELNKNSGLENTNDLSRSNEITNDGKYIFSNNVGDSCDKETVEMGGENQGSREKEHDQYDLNKKIKQEVVSLDTVTDKQGVEQPLLGNLDVKIENKLNNILDKVNEDTRTYEETEGSKSDCQANETNANEGIIVKQEVDDENIRTNEDELIDDNTNIDDTQGLKENQEIGGASYVEQVTETIEADHTIQ